LRLVAARDLLRDYSESPVTSVSLEAERNASRSKVAGRQAERERLPSFSYYRYWKREFQGQIRNQPLLKERNRAGTTVEDQFQVLPPDRRVPILTVFSIRLNGCQQVND
jgi:hypothetical protein